MNDRALASKGPFGLNFERHRPEPVQLPGRTVRRGSKVQVLPERGTTQKADKRLWQVKKIEKVGGARRAHIELLHGSKPELQVVAADDLVAVAEFRDRIYPGLVSAGKVKRGGDKPVHTVINGENYHALKALTFTHRGKVDAIYIDPPYNTGAKDWKYNNDYDSMWLAMMERRLKVARDLLSPSATLVVTIDEHEVHTLALLLEQLYPEFTRQMATIVINPKGVKQDYLSRVEEYAIFCFGPESRIFPGPDNLLSQKKRAASKDGLSRPRWKGLLRSGDASGREDRERMFYPVWLDPNSRRIVKAGNYLPLGEEPDRAVTNDKGHRAAWPIRKDGSLGRWNVGAESLNRMIDLGYVALGRFDRSRNTWGIKYLSQQFQQELQQGVLRVISRDKETGVADVAYVDKSTARVRTVWHRSQHDAGAHGTDLLKTLLSTGRSFPFPKSLYSVEDTLRILVSGKPNATVLDFFAGSGTTAHAVMRLNRQDDGRRQCISITNNEVSADEQKALRKQGLRPGDAKWEELGICDHITKPRIKAAITGQTPDGQPIKGDYKFTDEFPMADGFEENAEFFTLTYETPTAISHNLAVKRIAPLLWMRAGSEGSRIDEIPECGWAVAGTYGLLTDLDQTADFRNALQGADGIRIAFIVTNDDRRFQAVAQSLPETIEPVRLCESYLLNFRFVVGDDA